MYSVDMNTFKKIRRTERKNTLIISADVLHSEKILQFTVIHTRINIITTWNEKTGTEGEEQAIMQEFNRWMKGGDMR